MHKTLLIIIASWLFASNAYAQLRIDYVESVKLDGIELVQPVNIQTLPKSFWNGGITKEVFLSGCTSNGEAYIDYKNKKVMLEFFSEHNEGIDLEKIFDKKSGNSGIIH